MFEEIKNIKTDRKSLRSFGITFGVILLIIAGFLFLKEIESYTVFIYVSLIFSLSGLIIPIILNLNDWNNINRTITTIFTTNIIYSRV